MEEPGEDPVDNVQHLLDNIQGEVAHDEKLSAHVYRLGALGNIIDTGVLRGNGALASGQNKSTPVGFHPLTCMERLPKLDSHSQSLINRYIVSRCPLHPLG